MSPRSTLLLILPIAVPLVTGMADAPGAPIPVAQAANRPLLGSPAPASVGSVAQARGMRVGAAVEARDLTSASFGRTVVEHFTSLTPENALKLGRHSTAHGFDWSEGDAIANFARDHGLGMRLHTFVWEERDGLLPDMSTLTPAACRARLTDHIHAAVRRYADVAVAIDVVNEPLDANGDNRMRRWTACLDADPIEFAFRATHAALAEVGRLDVSLVLNEYGIMEPGPKADGMWRLVRDLRARGVPVDTVGVQAHVDAAHPPEAADMVAALTRYAEVGLRVEVTELDVILERPRADRSRFDDQHARVVRDVASACLRAAGTMCSGVTSWGVSDDVHWRVRGVGGSRETPTLLNERHQPKAAYLALIDALAPRALR
ncbi:MAG TPA: endo-1,4-beta-xylanase [Myxococcota bacterium]|nr:endo-1,4-beta-xylanase [Myxococcota bacterium]